MQLHIQEHIFKMVLFQTDLQEFSLWQAFCNGFECKFRRPNFIEPNFQRCYNLTANRNLQPQQALNFFHRYSSNLSLQSDNKRVHKTCNFTK